MADFEFKPTFPIAGVADLYANRPYKEAQMRAQQQQQLVEGIKTFAGGVDSLVQRRNAMAQALAIGNLLAPPQDDQVATVNGHPVMRSQTAAGGVNQVPVPNQPLPNPKAQQIAQAVYGVDPKQLLGHLFPQRIEETVVGPDGQIIGNRTAPKGSIVKTLPQKNTNSTANLTWDTATPQQQALATAMYEGRVRPSDIGFRERGTITMLANEYARQNGLSPFKSYAGDVNAGMAKFSTTGKMGQNATSLNTALGHLSDAYDSYQRLGNTNQAWLNKPINWLKKNTNDPEVVALGINLNALQGELANVFKQSGATDQEINHWREFLSENLTPAQYIGAADKIDRLLQSRLNALDYQRNAAGGGTGVPLISPHAKDISNRLGSTQKESKTGSRVTPNGVSYTVSD